jgi:hypothetical protein
MSPRPLVLLSIALTTAAVAGKETAKAVYTAAPRVQASSVEIRIHPSNTAITDKDIKSDGAFKKGTQVSPGTSELPDSPFDWYGPEVALEEGAPVRIDICIDDLQVVRKQLQQHDIPCKVKGEKVSKENLHVCPAFYYEVTWRMPTRLVATRDGEVVATARYNPPAVTGFGYNKNTGFLEQGELDAAWDPGELAQRAIVHRLDEIDDIVQSFVYTGVAEEKVRLRLPRDKDYDYSDIEKAAERAAEALDAMRKGKKKPGPKAIDDAMDLFEREIATADLSDKDARIDAKAARKLHAAVAQLALYRHDHDRALEHAERALELYQTEGFQSDTRIGQYQELIGMIEARSGLAPGGPVDDLDKADNLLDQARRKRSPYDVVVAGSGMQACGGGGVDGGNR